MVLVLFSCVMFCVDGASILLIVYWLQGLTVNVTIGEITGVLYMAVKSTVKL